MPKNLRFDLNSKKNRFTENSQRHMKSMNKTVNRNPEDKLITHNPFKGSKTESEKHTREAVSMKGNKDHIKKAR